METLDAVGNNNVAKAKYLLAEDRQSCTEKRHEFHVNILSFFFVFCGGIFVKHLLFFVIYKVESITMRQVQQCYQNIFVA